MATLWWVLFWVAVIVFVIVMGLLAYALWRPRRRSGNPHPGEQQDSGGIGSGRLFVGIGGALIPALVLVGVMIYTVGVQNAISMPTDATLRIQVIGHQWW